MIVFLSCTKTKALERCEAKNMYRGEIFKKSYQYAKILNPRKIYILSAKYYVLEENDIIEPYEMTLSKMTKFKKMRWAYNCIQILKNKNQDFKEKAVFLCGENYRKFIEVKFKNHICPISGLSFGNQLKFYKNEIGESK